MSEAKHTPGPIAEYITNRGRATPTPCVVPPGTPKRKSGRPTPA